MVVAVTAAAHAVKAEASEHVFVIGAVVFAIFMGACCYGAYFLFFKEKERRKGPEAQKDSEAPKGARASSRIAENVQSARETGRSARSVQSSILYKSLESHAPPRTEHADQPIMKRSQMKKSLRECKTLGALNLMQWGPEMHQKKHHSIESESDDEVLTTARKILQGDAEETRVINYDTASLGTWGVFQYATGTVMQSRRLWTVMGYLTLVALIMGALVNLYPKPQEIDPSGFRKIATFLKVFVAFLIGFYITQALGTWKQTVGGYLKLCNAVKNTQTGLLVFGVDSMKVQTVVRYGALSVVFLTKELEFALLKKENKVLAEEAMFDQLEEEGHITANERQRLEIVNERAELMWLWVASYLAKLSEEGEIPPMASPSFGRMLAQAQGGEIGIREVHTAISIQTPFIYVHTLAALVHVNNILCAISLGLSIGISVGTLMVAMGWHPMHNEDAHIPGGISHSQAQEMGPPLQKIAVALLGEGIGPFMYTAFLQIALSLAYPFGEDSKVARIPHHLFITKLLANCESSKAMAEHPPLWERPHFKKPAAAAAPAAAAPAAKAAAAAAPRI